MDDSIAVPGAPQPATLQHLKAPALVLVIVILAGMALLWSLDLDATWEPPYLNLILQLSLVTGSSLLICALAANSFLRSGSWPVLWLGAGSLTYGLASALGTSLLQLAGPDLAITTNNLCVLLSATLYFLGAFFAHNGIAPREAGAGRRATAVQVYLGVTVIVVLITAAAFTGLLPPFFAQGTGGTPWRQLVLVVNGLLFLSAGLTVLGEYRQTGADFLYWFGLGLVLTALVQAGSFASRAVGNPVSWLTRSAILLSALYLLAAVVVALQQARAANLPASEALASFFWRDKANVELLFQSIRDAIIVTDRRFVITDWNRAAEVAYGWPAHEVIGKPAIDVLRTAYPSDAERGQVLEAIQQAGAWRGEVVQRHRDGREFPVLVTVSALRDAAGRLVGTVAVNRDISERVALEQQLREANAQIGSQAAELQVAAVALEQRVAERTAELSRREAELRQANEALQQMSARLVDVQENERRALSRELHDESGQLLTLLTIRLGQLRQAWEGGASPAEALDEIRGIAGQLAESLHRVSVDLRPASLDRDGLLAALAQYLASYRKTYGLQVDLVADGWERGRLTADVESSLYRIVQEALTNVARHAHASAVSVLLTQRADGVVVVVEDNGRGFDVEAAARAGRLGLAGMRERAELRGGSLTIESRPGAGAAVYVEIPCPPHAPAPPVPVQPQAS